jgi:lipopolysaccharide cholinephosphotransferase
MLKCMTTFGRFANRKSMLSRASTLSIVLVIASCGDSSAIDTSPCQDAFNYNRNVDTATNPAIPYMKTCGLSVKSARVLRDVYFYDMTVNQQYVDAIYNELSITDKIFTEANIPYAINGGTLLGAIRNGGLIPNDDDADIVVDEKYESKIKKSFETFDKMGFILKPCEMLGYKVYSKKIKTTGLDIFLLKRRTINGKDVMACARGQAFQYWPNEMFDPVALTNLQKISYGHLSLSTVPLDEAFNYLNRTYGNNWYTETYKIWDHVDGKEGRGKKEKLLPNEYYYLRSSK